ncbi:MAG: hypothetical protein KKA19_02255, partial [Candidatus Margulisbacteria bacterium]|nr:hypothetical protein [Candidatus Margulisiibacteriota bacterium]
NIINININKIMKEKVVHIDLSKVRFNVLDRICEALISLAELTGIYAVKYICEKIPLIDYPLIFSVLKKGKIEMLKKSVNKKEYKDQYIDLVEIMKNY